MLSELSLNNGGGGPLMGNPSMHSMGGNMGAMSGNVGHVVDNRPPPPPHSNVLHMTGNIFI